MQGLVSKVDAGCQTEGSWTAMAEQLQEAKAEGSALQKEVSSLRHGVSSLPFALIVPPRRHREHQATHQAVS